MFEVKDSKQIGAYIKKLIYSKYPSQRQFCIEYIKKMGFDKADSEQIRRTTNKVNQIIKGDRATVQVNDLPFFCELLQVSCEQILSCGDCYRPIKNHITNYEVAFSRNPKEWEAYMNREDNLFLNYDEYGKSVVDYALEFKNYDFIKFLMKNGHLEFADNSAMGNGISFGLKTDIKRRDIGETDIWPIPNTYYGPDNLFYEEVLRTRVLALATEKKDFKMLEKLRARMNPAIYNMDVFGRFSDFLLRQRNEDLICKIAESEDDIIEYYSDEYEVKDRPNHTNRFVYPYLSEVIEIMIENGNKNVERVLEKSIIHNEYVFNCLSKNLNTYMQMLITKADKEYGDGITPELKKINRDIAIKNALYGFGYNSDAKIVSYRYCIKRGVIEGMVSNIISIEKTPEKEPIKELVEKLNDLANKIIELGKER